MEDPMQLWYRSAYEAACLFESIEAFSRRAMRAEPLAPIAAGPSQPEGAPRKKSDRQAGSTGPLPRRNYRQARPRAVQDLEVRQRSFWA